MNRLTRIAAWFLAASALLAQDATIQGVVRDSKGKPVPAISVQLKTDRQTLSVKTGAEGEYHFLKLQPGAYALQAEGGAQSGPIILKLHETRSIDLALAEPPPYSDMPSFIVAGVTDGANRGGHGSDPVLHSADALTKATASLSHQEKERDPLETVRAYEHAAELDPSESHLFDWGAELLSHRAAEQAAEVFGRGNRLFPRSTRMLLGLAVSWYSRGAYDQAEKFFFEAADLNPADPTPYLFLGQARNSPVGESAGFQARMERFALLLPDNAWANYYYGAGLRLAAPAKARALLEKSVRIDPRLAVAWLQLGILFADEKNFSRAISAWQSALAADPSIIEAHYRLAQAYRRIGEPDKAKPEIALYEQLSKQSAQQEDRERAAIREFVFKLRDVP